MSADKRSTMAARVGTFVSGLGLHLENVDVAGQQSDVDIMPKTKNVGITQQFLS